MKSRFILFAAGILLAMAFTLSCSDDKDDSPKVVAACYFTSISHTEGLELCMEFDETSEANSYIQQGFTKEDICQGMDNDDDTMSGLITKESCQSGYKLKCPSGFEGIVVYFYGEVPVDECPDLSEY